MRRAFTLVEVMVATMLLAMLVTILTMVFSQSSIAWSTGVASVTALGDMRETIAVRSTEAENAVRADDGQVVFVTSVWADSDDASAASRLRQASGGGLPRTLAQRLTEKTALLTKEALQDPVVFNAGNGNEITLGGTGAQGQDSFIVGVRSDGPDGKTGGDYSWDDISTLPEEVVK